MEEFLKTVARHYKEKSCSEAQLNGELASLPLSRYLFCFPNRRSGLFFSRHLREAFGGPCCVPAMTTIGELYGKFSQRQVLDRTSLLFRLFHVYDKLSQRKEKETFDQFVFWGDMLLSDFDDVDRYLVDADQLFANVKDLKEIEARFSGLDEAQIEVIRSFWRSFQPERDYPSGDKHEVFGQTWAILSQLYHAFKENLKADNLAYEGMLEREVVERLKQHEKEVGEKGLFEDLHFDKVVFVGLTAVSKVDREFMSLLKVHGRAEFCWDYADPRLDPEVSKATSAAFFTKQNLSDFANELSVEELRQGIVPEEQRNVELYSVSSGVGQTRQARKILQQWEQTIPGFDPFRTAVVLPDEKLLIPMLYAVPMDNFNVTMGYNLKNTPIAAFVGYLSALQQVWKPSTRSFYFRQVLPILSHSFTLGLSGEKARGLCKQITEQNMNQVPQEVFAEDPFLRLIFQPLQTAQETLTYLDQILGLLMEKAAQDIKLQNPEEPEEIGEEQLEMDLFADDTEEGDPQLFADTDYEFFYHYKKTVITLANEVKTSNMHFTPKTLFLLLDKLVAGVSVPFSGEPLRGLQVMGVLETRALDFDNIIILSMNEGVFPAKPSQNTFVPMSLRDAFGMPTQKHRDSVFAYHFYRLIGRAKNLSLIYDSRTDGMQTGEESRYVKQLRFLMGHDDLVAKTVKGDIGIISPNTFQVNKSQEVLNLLNLCVGAEGTHYLSASSLKYYIDCPLKFYLSFARQLHEDDEVNEGVDSILFGNILHDAMQKLYAECEGREIQASMIDTFLNSPSVIEKTIARSFVDILKIHLNEGETPESKIEGYNLLIAQILCNYVKETLRHDKKQCPFVYLASEQSQRFLYPINDQLSVKIKCIYDRLDQIGGTDTVRIVDYKTGNSSHGAKLVFPSIEDLFQPGSKGSKEAFQVMLYSLLLEHASASDLRKMHLKKTPDHIMPNLYFVRDFGPRNNVTTYLSIKESRNDVTPILDFTPFRKEFDALLKKQIAEIFDPTVPFRQCEDVNTCKNCPFNNLCKRI